MTFNPGSDAGVILKLFGFKTVSRTILPFLLFIICLGGWEQGKGIVWL